MSQLEVENLHRHEGAFVPLQRTPEQAIMDLEPKISEFSTIFKALGQFNREDAEQVLSMYPEDFQPFLENNGGIIHDHDHTNVHVGAPIKSIKISIEQLLAQDPTITDFIQLPDEALKRGYVTLKGHDFDESVLNGTEGKPVDPVNKQNLDLLIAASLRGIPVTILTGKDVMAFPTMFYIQKRTEEFISLAQKLHSLGDNRGIEFGFVEEDSRSDTPMIAHSRPLTVDGKKPVIMFLGTCNGGQLRDVFNGYELISHRPIDDGFWVELASNPEIDDLLRRSTTLMRKFQLYQAFPEARKTTAHRAALYEQFSQTTDPEEKAILAKKILGDYINISYSGAKANLVFDRNAINTDTKLQEKWRTTTGMEITEDDSYSLVRSFLKIVEKRYGNNTLEWPIEVAEAHANGVLYLDISARGVNKGSTIPIIEQTIHDIYARFIPNYVRQELHLVTNGDNPTGNDQTMLEILEGSTSNYRSLTVSVKHDPIIGQEYPLFLKYRYRGIDIPEDEIHLTNQWLKHLHIVLGSKNPSLVA